MKTLKHLDPSTQRLLINRDELLSKIEGLELDITILMGNRADLQAENVKLLEGLVTAVMERDTLRDTLDYTEEKVELLKAYKGNLEE